jgi:hypothetical protein
MIPDTFILAGALGLLLAASPPPPPPWVPTSSRLRSSGAKAPPNTANAPDLIESSEIDCFENPETPRNLCCGLDDADSLDLQCRSCLLRLPGLD